MACFIWCFLSAATAEDIADATRVAFSSLIVSSIVSFVVVVVIVSITVSLTGIPVWALTIVLAIFVIIWIIWISVLIVPLICFIRGKPLIYTMQIKDFLLFGFVFNKFKIGVIVVTCQVLARHTDEGACVALVADVTICFIGQAGYIKVAANGVIAYII